MPRQLFMRRPNLENLPPMPESPPGYVVRRFQAGEEAAIGQALAGAFGDEWPVERVQKSLTANSQIDAVFVVAFNDVPVAHTSARLAPDDHPGSGYIHWVGVHPAHQGKRLGYLINLKVLYHFREIGCRDAVLETDDFRIPAIKTYLSLGFVPEHNDPTHPERWEKIMEQLKVDG